MEHTVQDITLTDSPSLPKWIAIAALALELIVISATALLVFVGLRDTLVQTTSIAMLTVLSLLLRKVPSLLFGRVSLFSLNKLLRYGVAVLVVLVFVLVGQ
jgi:hypothetical protein